MQNDSESAALDHLSQGYDSATVWVASRCNMGCAATRRLLRGMASRGLVEPVRAHRSGRIFWWRITDAGRAAHRAA